MDERAPVAESLRLLQKKNSILRYGGKGCATYGRNGLSGWRNKRLQKFRLVYKLFGISFGLLERPAVGRQRRNDRRIHRATLDAPNAAPTGKLTREALALGQARSSMRARVGIIPVRVGIIPVVCAARARVTCGGYGDRDVLENMAGKKAGRDLWSRNRRAWHHPNPCGPSRKTRPVRAPSNEEAAMKSAPDAPSAPLSAAETRVSESGDRSRAEVADGHGDGD